MKDLDFLIYIWGICAYNCDAFSGNHGTSGDREAHSVWRVAACSRLCVTQISWNGKKLHGGPKSHVCVGLCKPQAAHDILRISPGYSGYTLYTYVLTDMSRISIRCLDPDIVWISSANNKTISTGCLDPDIQWISNR